MITKVHPVPETFHLHESEPGTLFRSNSIATCFIAKYSFHVGQNYLKTVIAPVFTHLVQSDLSFEVCWIT